MKEKENDEKGGRSRRFREAVDGPVVRRRYAYERTEDIARDMGLTIRQIMNYVYRHNTERWARKLGSVLSAENREKGKKGGRPRKNT